MPKNVFSKREDFICGKVDDLVIDIKILNITDELKEYLITKIYDIQHDAQRMENKLIFRKQEVEELKAEICRLKTAVMCWAACSERLPDNIGSYLCFWENCYVGMLFFNSNKEWCEMWQQEKHKPTHWMSLPKPPCT